MSSRLHHLRPRPDIAVAALAMVLCQAANAKHAETVCPPPAMSHADSEAVATGLTGTPLPVNGKVPTRGTNPYESPELFSDLVVDSQTFNFQTPQGIVKGRVLQRVRQGADHHCKCEWEVTVAPDSAPGVCVTELQIAGVQTHGLEIVADYRDDVPNVPPPAPIRPLSALRPAEGFFKFQFAKSGMPGVCPGQRSYPVLLNTSNDSVDKHGTLRIKVTGDAMSPDMLTFVPYP